MSWFSLGIPFFKKAAVQPAPVPDHPFAHLIIKHTTGDGMDIVNAVDAPAVFTSSVEVCEKDNPPKDDVPLGDELEGEAAATHIVHRRIYSDYHMAKPANFTDEYKGWLVKVLIKNIGFQCNKCGVGITQANCRCSHCKKYDAASYDYFSQDGYDLKERRMANQSRQEYDAWYKQLEAHWEGKPCLGCHDRTGCRITNSFCEECQYYWSCAFDPALPRCRYQFLPNPPRRKLEANTVYVFG
jgi:hypothetical protein